jgi:hypothetical protein
LAHGKLILDGARHVYEGICGRGVVRWHPQFYIGGSTDGREDPVVDFVLPAEPSDAVDNVATRGRLE